MPTGKKTHLLHQHSQERSSTHANIKKLSLHHFSPAPDSTTMAYSRSTVKCCLSHTLLTSHVSEALQFEKISAIPGERDDPPIEFASSMCHFVFICTGTPPGIDEATEHRSFSVTYLMVSL